MALPRFVDGNCGDSVPVLRPMTGRYAFEGAAALNFPIRVCERNQELTRTASWMSIPGTSKIGPPPLFLQIHGGGDLLEKRFVK